MIRSVILFGALAAGTAAFAADLGKRPGAPAAPVASAACKETRSLAADVFGFTTGSDVADLGAWGASVTVDGFSGSRGGTFSNIVPTLQVSGSFLPCLEVGPFVNGAFINFKPYGGGASLNTTGYGGGLELKYKFLGRSVHGVGLTLAVTPSITQWDFPGPVNGTGYGVSVRLLSDFEIVRDKLFGAVNLEYVPGWLRSGGITTESSFLNFRLAASYKLTDTLFIGAEASHQRAYTGTSFNRDVGSATFVGPTFFWQATDKISVNGAWAYQVAGETPVAGRKLNLETFNRHNARVKVAYAF